MRINASYVLSTFILTFIFLLVFFSAKRYTFVTYSVGQSVSCVNWPLAKIWKRCTVQNNNALVYLWKMFCKRNKQVDHIVPLLCFFYLQKKTEFRFFGNLHDKWLTCSIAGLTGCCSICHNISYAVPNTLTA